MPVKRGYGKSVKCVNRGVYTYTLYPPYTFNTFSTLDTFVTLVTLRHYAQLIGIG